MKTIEQATIALALVSALVLSGCASAPEEPTATVGFEADALIGISWHQRDSRSWYPEDGYFKDGLTAAGFQPHMVWADGGVPDQQNQIDSMIENGAKVIVVSAIDGSQLGDQLAKAKEAGIFIIAFERLLMNTADVDLYIAFDNCEVGRLQGTTLLEGLTRRSAPPWNIELIAGSPDDANSQPFFDCAMEILQPRIDSGDLVVPSGQLSREQVATVGWHPKNVQARFDVLLSEFYADGTQLDGILSPNDTLARAAVTTVLDSGLPNPVVTGQDSEFESIYWIAEGKQYSTISNDIGVIISEVIKIIQMLQHGEDPPVNDAKTFDNGAKIVPAYLLAPVPVTKDNLCSVYSPDTVAGRAAMEVC